MANFDLTIEQLKKQGLKTPNELERFKLSNSSEILKNALKFYLSYENKAPLWLPEYNEVAEWLEDNQGRGLFMYGNCGRGKSLLGRYVLPAIYLKYFRKVVNTYDIQDMNTRIDEVIRKPFISLDDIGTEEIVNSFGNKRMAFAEIMDAVEKEKKIIIVSTNLTESQLRNTYGDRILDRIKSTTKRVLFEGKSLRK